MGQKEDIEKVESKVITVRDTQVILDRDLAALYGVETRDINKAVKNNPNKFPKGYIIDLTASEKHELVENFHRFNSLKHSTVNPHAFTEKGLYLLATILNSEPCKGDKSSAQGSTLGIGRIENVRAVGSRFLSYG